MNEHCLIQTAQTGDPFCPKTAGGNHALDHHIIIAQAHATRSLGRHDLRALPPSYTDPG